MIRFTLRCDKGHDFESWFASAGAYDRLQEEGRNHCAVCGSPSVEKAPMAPRIARDVGTPVPSAPEGAPRETLSSPRSEAERALAALREKVERESDYVGLSFASEARAMHDGEKPHRPIHGEARPDQARALIEDGVPVAPLPFLPRRRTN